MRPDDDDANGGDPDGTIAGTGLDTRSHNGRETGIDRTDTGRTGIDRTTETIERVEEIARVDVVEHVTGRVQVRTRTETIEESVDTVLESVTAEVEHVRIDRYLDEGEAVPKARREGDTWILPVLEEVVVVQKRLRFKEEVRVTQRGDRQHVSVPVSTRRQVVEMEREPPAGDVTSVDLPGAGGRDTTFDKP